LGENFKNPPPASIINRGRFNLSTAHPTASIWAKLALASREDMDEILTEAKADFQ